MSLLEPILRDYGMVILDGGLATELERQGWHLDGDPMWSAKVLLEDPDRARWIHRSYLEAGADVILTISYQITPASCAAGGLSETETVALLKRAVEVAVEARDAFWADPARRRDRPRPLVVASVGPYGAYPATSEEYRGAYGLTVQELVDFHRPRVAVLAESEADMLACETIPCWTEAEALAELLREFPRLAAWISFTARDESRIAHGEPLAECAARLESWPQIAAVGVNCTPPEYLPRLITAARTATVKPIVAYPNSGEVFSTERRVWEGRGIHPAYGRHARLWWERGARLIGGCCRTTPDDIAQIATFRRRLRAEHSELG